MQTTYYLGDPDFLWDAFTDMERCFSSVTTSFPLMDTMVDEKTGTFRIDCAIAGYSKDRLEIIADDSNLVIKGKKSDEKSSFTVKSQTIKHSDFNIKIPIATKYDLSKVEVNLVDGILSISIPLAEDKKPKSISIL